MSKICSKCKIEKNYEEFHKCKKSKDGYRYDCILCRKNYNIANRDKKKEYNKEYWQKNKDVLTVNNKTYRVHNSEKIQIQRKNYRSREEIKKYIKRKNKEYLPIRKHKIKEKRLNNFKYRLSEVLRSKIHKILNGKKTSYKKIIGCELEQLKKWLEYKFDDKMNWNNYGIYWQIDHVIPINSFTFENEKEIQICFNWKNLQPLEKSENKQKTDKIILPYILNNIIMGHRFIQKYNLNHLEYQDLKETLNWLREKLKYGKNLKDDTMDNPHPRIL
jgi:hypothetical protein